MSKHPAVTEVERRLSELEREMIADRTLTYLTDEELRELQKLREVRTYSWEGTRANRPGGSVEVAFTVSSASYITVWYDGQQLDCINVWDHASGTPTVRDAEDFRRRVEAYWAEQDTVRDYIRGGLGIEYVR